MAEKEASWGRMIGNGIKYTVYGALTIGLVLTGADLVAKTIGAFGYEGYTNLIGDSLKWALNAVGADKFFGIVPIDGGFVATKAASEYPTIGGNLTSFATIIDKGISDLVGLFSTHGKDIAKVSAGVAGGIAVGKFTSKEAERRQSGSMLGRVV